MKYEFYNERTKNMKNEEALIEGIKKLVKDGYENELIYFGVRCMEGYKKSSTNPKHATVFLGPLLSVVR